MQARYRASPAAAGNRPQAGFLQGESRNDEGNGDDKRLFMEHWQNLLEKLKEIYGQRFNYEIYDDARRYVNDHLPERKMVEHYPDFDRSKEQSREDKLRQRRRNENVL